VAPPEPVTDQAIGDAVDPRMAAHHEAQDRPRSVGQRHHVHGLIGEQQTRRPATRPGGSRRRGDFGARHHHRSHYHRILCWLHRSRARPWQAVKSIVPTILLGVVGSFVGGFLGRLLFHHGSGFVQTSSWIGSIIGAVIALLIYVQVEQRRA
jgi:uncharacterized membrane protein YeaQ/YmgE (transglycosylase-associated protein family)